MYLRTHVGSLGTSYVGTVFDAALAGGSPRRGASPAGLAAEMLRAEVHPSRLGDQGG